MNVYKVSIKNGIAESAEFAEGLVHGEIGLTEDSRGVQWMALECDNKNEAIDIANKVVDLIWK